MGGKNHTSFKPGHMPVNKTPGRPRVPPDVKEARLLTKAEVDLALSKLLLMNEEELQIVKEDPNCTVLQKLVISILEKGIEGGDAYRLGFLFDRTIGKTKEQIDVKLNRLDEMTPEEKYLAAKRIIEMKEIQ